MNYSVRVYLSNGIEIPFGSVLSSPEEIKKSILDDEKDWYAYENGTGEGYFKIAEVVLIETTKKNR